ncbi:hypothetical protein CDAR_554161 [Caerostris darwini]|uniref:Uncharacterized protein n=1 Tax=Caerostris darwini TaxID=1538125 RepID=A0AAV4SEQ4_9ARAC|nr:hypothetical protein CDAR_554161 [Caerostris darwini]
MDKKINIAWEALDDVSVSQDKCIKISLKNFPFIVRENARKRNRLRKRWQICKCPYNRRLLNKTQTKCRELITEHKQTFWHELNVIVFKDIYKYSKIRTPHMCSNLFVFDTVKELGGSDEFHFKNGYFYVAETNLKIQPQLLNSINYQMQACTFASMSKYILRIKKKKITRFQKAVKESPKNYLLIEKFDMAEEYDMENELLHFLDVKNFNETNACHEMHSEQPECIAVSLELCELYYQAVRKLIGYGHIKYLKRYFYHLSSVTNSWCQFKKDCSLFNQLRCNTLYYRIAYIYKNSTCLSSAVAHYFGIVLSQHTNIVTELLQRDEIRICSFGRGSTSDIVGLIKVLESIFNVTELNVHVSIIDCDKKWQNACITVLQGLKCFRNSICKIEFIKADLSLPFNSKVIYAIENAHIVSMVKFFSDLEKKVFKSLFQEVHSLINPGSVLFFLDFPDFNIVNACGRYLADLPGYKLLYEAPFDSYTLHISVVEKHLLYYIEKFGTNICNTMFKAFCRVWVKCDNILADENIKMETVGFEERVLRKKIKKFESYCNKFQNLSDKMKINSYLPWKEYFSAELKKRRYSERKIQKALEEAQKNHVELRRLGKLLLIDPYENLIEEKRKIRDKKRNDMTEWITNFHESREKAVSYLQTYQQSISKLLQHYKRQTSSKKHKGIESIF